jgi:hypothetical protein
MISTKQSLRECALEFLLGVVLLSVVGTAAFAQTNTAYGTAALQKNTTGMYDSAFGYAALSANTSADFNTAVGFAALVNATTGGVNTALGADALLENTTGGFNTATGSCAMCSNTNDYYNTATGFYSLLGNTTGSQNTATGTSALDANTIGSENVATGQAALYSNSNGSYNTADGYTALYNNTTGSVNTAFGDYGLYSATTGQNNIAVGNQAGYNVTIGSNNIEIGSLGTAAESKTVRIGTQGTQTATYIAGITGTPMTGGQAVNVVVSSSGQLGVRPSSAGYKKDIQPLSNHSQGLWQLRPVTFRYKQDPQGERQYGLIAEQVAKVYPELVVRDTKGEVESVQYEELIRLMLNEMQRQRDEVQHQQAALNALKAQDTALQTRLERLEQGRTKTLASR